MTILYWTRYAFLALLLLVAGALVWAHLFSGKRRE